MLTGTERAKIRRFLGWPSRFHQTNSDVEQAMNALDSEADEEVLARALIVSIEDIDTKLVAAHARIKFESVGEIRGPGWREIKSLRREGGRFVERMRALLGVPLASRYFGGGPVGSNAIRTG